jgi:hypothetical protein
MVEGIITLRGISEARRSAVTPSTRLITFPDRITRHITLPGWQWAVLDRFERDGSVATAAEIAVFAFEDASVDPDYPDKSFEDKLRLHFSLYLHEGVTWTTAYLQRRANNV